MKLAPHRSITFWSGILVMAFIGWAWWDSLELHRWTTYHDITVSNGGGTLVFIREVSSPGTLPPASPLHAGRDELSLYPIQSIPPFPSPLFIRGGGKDINNEGDAVFEDKTFQDSYETLMLFSPRESWVIFVPHWAVALIFSLLWAVLLLWRARRRKRALEKNPEPGPS